MNRCIFHIPCSVKDNATSGSQIRPKMMIQAFENLGYHVEVVMGCAKERKVKIEEIEKSIKSGVRYDFVYSESSTMPTLLTEENHLPTHPFVDFNFFNLCKRNDIPIFLFYRDIYWKFPIYRERVNGLKYIVAKSAYLYDIRKYEKYLTNFCVPTKRLSSYVPSKRLQAASIELPPGCSVNIDYITKKNTYYQNKVKLNDGELSLFYVGGVGSQYRFEKLLSAVKDFDNIKLTICCRKSEWEKERKNYDKYLSERVNIVHESGEGLIKYYQNSDICLTFFEQDDYRKLAMPIKLFEYLSYAIPIISTNDTAAGDFVENNDIGWSIDYDEKDLKMLLLELSNDYSLIFKKHVNSLNVMNNNTWENRAECIIELSKEVKQNGI